MTLSLQSALSFGTVLVALVLAYADLKYTAAANASLDLRNTTELKGFRRTTDRKIEKLEIHVSHLQSWLDDVKVKR